MATNTSEHDLTSVNITPSMFYDILQQSQEVQMRPILLMAVGLPNSGKSRAIKHLLQLKSDGSSRQQEFLCYNMMAIVSKQKEIDEETTIGNSQLFSHDFGFLAGLKTSLHREFQKLSSFTEDGPLSVLDDDDIHHRHRMGLIDTWKKLKEGSIPDESRLLQSKELGEGPALVKIWDVDFDSFSLQFLRCFSGHFYNSYTWLFTNVERDLDKLYVPPSKDDTQLMARRSRIQYLLNPSKLSSKLNGTRHDVCTVFAIQKYKTDSSQIQVVKLQQQCQNAASQIGSPDLISKNVISFSFDMTDDKILFNQLRQTAALKTPQGIPLSHLFLRGSLELESSVFMRRGELKRKAKSCGIYDEKSFDEFCKSFTSFGSIIDVGLVSTSDIIIVKPDEFLTTLNQAFNFERIKDDQVAHNGILTSDVAFSLLGKEYQLFLEALEAAGLATPVAGGQCQPPQDRMCYYIPSVRLHGEEINFNPKHIQLVTSMRYPSISLIVALTKHLLQAIPSSKLMLSIDRNKTKIKSPESEVEIVFHGEVIEFAVSQKSFITEIVKACKNLPYQLQNRYGKAKFYFAVLCEKDDNYIGLNFYRERHILPIDGDLGCDSCTFTENMKIWSSTIKEVGLDKKFELDGRLTNNDITRLSSEISTYERVYVHEFIKAMGQDRQLPNDQSKWENVLMAAIADWNAQSHREPTKKKMAEILLELHKEFKHIHTDIPLKFKELARQLDIQTLSIEQKDSLKKYYYQKLQNEKKLEIKNKLSEKDRQISQLMQTATMKDENSQQLENKLQEIILQLNNSQNGPIEFENEAEELEIVDKLKKAIQHHSALQNQTHEKDSHIHVAHLTNKLRNETTGIVEEFQQDNTIDTSHLVVHDNAQFTLSDVSKLMVILQPVEDDWYQLGHHLDMEESTLSDAKQTGIPLEYLLQRWCGEEGTLMKLENALTSLGKKDLISGLRQLKSVIKKDVSVQFNYMTPSIDTLDYLSEVHKAANKLFIAQGDGHSQLLNWEEYGLRIGIPKGALMSSETVEISVVALVGGQFKFPKRTQLVSAVYAISVSKPLVKPLRLDMQHCVNITRPSQINYLKFAIASVNTQSLPYQFEVVKGGDFTVNSFYGSIDRQEFSLVAILVVHGDDDSDSTPSDTSDEEKEENEEEQEEIEGEELDEFEVQPNESNQASQPINQPLEEEKHIDSDGVMSTDVSYAGVVYYEIKGSEDLVTFATAKNLNALLQYINDYHPNAEKETRINITYQFKPGCKYIELIIDAPQKYATDGWTIHSHCEPCQMYQKHINNFGSQDYPLPSKCLISVYSINRPDTVPVLHYGIPLEGVDPPVTIFIHRALRTTNTGTPLLEATLDPLSFSGAQQDDISKIYSQAPKVKDLLIILADINHMWELIGVALDVDDSTIRGLTKSEVDNKVKLYEVLKSWIDKDKSVTWKAVVDAVEGKIVDKMVQGRKIREFLSQPEIFAEYIKN